MAIGDVKSEMAVSLASGALYSIRPPAGEEWVIHNVYYGNALELYITNGANTFKIDGAGTSGAYFGMCMHLNNTQYLQIKNTSAGTAHYAYDGIQTK